MKVLFLGNSHLSAWWKAWNRLAAEGEAPRADFVISRTYGSHPVQFVDRAENVHEFRRIITPEPSLVTLSDYAAIVIVGMRVMSTLPAAIHATHRTFDEAVERGIAPITETFWLSSAWSMLEGSHATELVTLLKPLVDVPILLVPSPHPSRLCVEMDSSSTRPFQTMLVNGDAPLFGQRWEALLDRYALEYIPVVKPPSAVIQDDIFTRADLGRAQLSGGANGGPNEAFLSGDSLHAGEAYGEACAPSVIEAIKTSGVIW